MANDNTSTEAKLISINAALAERAERLSSMRAIVSIGWDGANNPMYRYHDELKLRSGERAFPSVAELAERAALKSQIRDLETEKHELLQTVAP